MSLEKILNEKVKRIAKNLAKGAVSTALMGTLLFSAGCGKNPLFTKLKHSTEQKQSFLSLSSNDIYSNNGESLDVKLTTGGERPSIEYKLPSDSSYTAVSGTKATIPMQQGKYGTLEIVGKVKGGEVARTTKTVYMGEIDSDAALEQAVLEIGVHPTSTTEDDIVEYRINDSSAFGREYDLVLKIRKNTRLPPYAWYAVNRQGGRNEVFDQDDKDYCNSKGEGYLFIWAENNNKEKISNEQNNSWPQFPD